MEKVDVYYHPNPHMRSFLLPEKIFPPVVERVRNPVNEISDRNLKRLGPVGYRVADEILRIKGVREIRVKPKELIVSKEETASWDEIEDRIISILDVSLKRKQIKLVKG